MRAVIVDERRQGAVMAVQGNVVDVRFGASTGLSTRVPLLTRHRDGAG
jgi:hypothetical protein